MPDPDASSRDQILDAGERLFAARGFARTTIKDIGHEAGLNSALLYYYFADKDELYREVLRRFVSRLVARTMSELTAEGSADDRLRALLRAQAELLIENPHFPRLMVRELAESEGAHAVEQFHLLASTTFRRLCELIEDGQRAGLFRKDVDPRFGAISTIAQVVYFFVARPAVRVLLKAGPEGPSPKVVREFARHAADFALAALAATAPSPRPRRAGKPTASSRSAR
ncbi:MAG TPA: TetR/AcrR family transcriptional regulator [Gemmatimonadales bacterium]|nr:TetR/AcrR family transcriptional regulator [Gemmatimonadales bacterium]